MKHVKLFEQFVNEGNDNIEVHLTDQNIKYGNNADNAYQKDVVILVKKYGGKFTSPTDKGIVIEFPDKRSVNSFEASIRKYPYLSVDDNESVNEGITESYYTAIADLGGKKTKENLDSFEEVQDFMDKMIKKHAISVEVIKFSQEGKSQTLKYDWDGEKWLKTSK